MIWFIIHWICGTGRKQHCSGIHLLCVWIKRKLFRILQTAFPSTPHAIVLPHTDTKVFPCVTNVLQWTITTKDKKGSEWVGVSPASYSRDDLLHNLNSPQGFKYWISRRTLISTPAWWNDKCPITVNHSTINWRKERPLVGLCNDLPTKPGWPPPICFLSLPALVIPQFQASHAGNLALESCKFLPQGFVKVSASSCW